MVFDILFLIFIGAGFYWGYQKGIIYAVFSLLAYFIGVIAALKFSYMAVKYLNGAVHMGPKAISILAFILVFILVVLLVRFIAWGLEKILQSFSLNFTNQLVGGLRAGMGYCGTRNIEELRTRTRFILVSAASVQESHPHDITIVEESPNYSAEHAPMESP